MVSFFYTSSVTTPTTTFLGPYYALIHFIALCIWVVSLKSRVTCIENKYMQVCLVGIVSCRDFGAETVFLDTYTFYITSAYLDLNLAVRSSEQKPLSSVGMHLHHPLGYQGDRNKNIFSLSSFEVSQASYCSVKMCINNVGEDHFFQLSRPNVLRGI